MAAGAQGPRSAGTQGLTGRPDWVMGRDGPSPYDAHDADHVMWLMVGWRACARGLPRCLRAMGEVLRAVQDPAKGTLSEAPKRMPTAVTQS